jgi:hypothetical protein
VKTFFSLFLKQISFKMSAQTNTEDVADGSKSKRTRAKTSFIWKYFKEEEIEQDGKSITVIKCQEMTDDGPCNVTYQNTGNSTGNAIYHLRTFHNIDKDGKIEESQKSDTNTNTTIKVS